ncbi:amidohydrolase family protein [Pseudomarimonas salicorniae]|uniref:Amidohydrolase family protein n=1 Tax=Pseudomarimonas salicorniae TaxID=2933270 RepID=A0ABT0GG23_9GAMM|nr:amidohydrolase family protein [Lysobacter sp. CAU 1642]MCK7592965.1 amidohydrolase family protein [Lysobacter sp. CAU 1642]
MPLRLLALLLIVPAAQADAPADSATWRYDWLTQGERSGSLVTRIEPDGQLHSEFEFNDRGRGPKLSETLRLGTKGLPESIRVEGKSYLGAKVDERFAIEDGQARWTTTQDQGKRAVDGPVFYAAAESTPQQLAVMARALLASEGGRLPLLPAGEASIETLRTERFEAGGDTLEATLYAIHGLDFTPNFIWLDAKKSLFALSFGWMGLLPEGRSELFERVRAIQEEAEESLLRKRAVALTRRLPGTWCLVNARWLDVDRGALQPASTLRIEDGRIAAIGSADEIGCEGHERIDAGGRVVLPGLWDMHVHVSAADGLLHIAHGVTGARDLANDHDQVVRLQASFASGELIGPRLQRAGFIDKKSPYTAPTGTPVDSLDEALAAIDRYAGQGYPQVKIYSSVPPDWVAPMARRLHGHGMRLSGHVPAFMSAEQAVRQGFDEIQHLNMLFLNFVSDENTDSRTPQRFLKVAEEAAGLDLDGPAVREFIALLKKEDVVVDPTVSIFDDMFRHRPGQVSPLLASVIDHLPPEVQRSARSGRLDITESNAARYAASADALLGMIRRLHEAGVRMVPGTDSIVGFTLHRELELYAQAGIPNAEVIRLATASAADIANTGVPVGRIAPGQAADLLVVEGDPLQDISDLRRGVLVVRGDRAYRPDALFRSLGIRPFAKSIH